MGESYRLGKVTVEVEARGDYLHVVLRGNLPTVEDVKQLTSLMRHLMTDRGIRRMLVSSTGLEHPLSTEGWAALWAWLNERTCRQFAWVVPWGTADVTVTSLNMAALGESLAFRAFATVVDAAHWLELRTTSERRGSLASASGAAPLAPKDDPRAEVVLDATSAKGRQASGATAAVREAASRPLSPRVDPRAEPSDSRQDSDAEDDSLDPKITRRRQD